MGMAQRMASAAVVGEGVDVRLSAIPGAGNGLFADRSFERNELITEYSGVLIGRETAEKLRAQGLHTHVRCLNMQHAYLDGLRQPVQGTGGGSFANDARDSERNNAAFVTIYDHNTGCDRVFLKALKPIGAGQEVFVSYGKVYWEVHTHAASPRTRRVAAVIEEKSKTLSARAKAYDRAAAVARRSRSQTPGTPEPESSRAGGSSSCSSNSAAGRGWGSQREVSTAAGGAGRRTRAQAAAAVVGPMTPSKGRRLQEDAPEAPATAMKRSKSTLQAAAAPGGSATAARAAARAAAAAERAAAGGRASRGAAAAGPRAVTGPLTPSKNPRRPSAATGYAAVEEERSPKRSKSVSPPHTCDGQAGAGRRPTRGTAAAVAPGGKGAPGSSGLHRRLFAPAGVAAAPRAADAGSRQQTPTAMQPATPSVMQSRRQPAAGGGSSRQPRGRHAEQQLPLVTQAAAAPKGAGQRIAITRLAAVPAAAAAAPVRPGGRIAITRLVPPVPTPPLAKRQAGQQRQQQQQRGSQRPGSGAAADTRAARDQAGSSKGPQQSSQQGRSVSGKAPAGTKGAAAGGSARGKAAAAAVGAAVGARGSAKQNVRGGAAARRTPPPPEPAAAAPATPGGIGGLSPRKLRAVLARWSPTKGNLVAAAQAVGNAAAAAAALFNARPSPSSGTPAGAVAGGRRGAAGTPLAAAAAGAVGRPASVNKMRPWV